MATIFGIEKSEAIGFIDAGIFCLPQSFEGKTDMHRTVAPIKCEDIVFIKHTTLGGLNITAVGVIRSDFKVDRLDRTCLPIKWVWEGNKTLRAFEEKPALPSEMLYEEHDILVQREIINLLPKEFQQNHEW
ncbi:MAG: hypothetical protein WA632_11025 [Gallionella sp.]